MTARWRPPLFRHSPNVAIVRAMLSLPTVPAPDDIEIPLYRGSIEEDLQIVSRNRLAERITGGLSYPSKMPCPAWGIPATRCRVGSLLAKREGTVCHSCYALRNRYAFPNVQAKLEERYRGLASPLWTPAMVFLIRWYAGRYFRWFDSGDVQGEPHLRNILTICRHTQDVLHWLPTREAEVVRSCKEDIPENLVIRLSAPRIDGSPPRGWPHTSTVVSVPDEATCRAPEQDGHCGECRDCWEPSVKNVSYQLH